jgi:hypothetical protein
LKELFTNIKAFLQDTPLTMFSRVALSGRRRRRGMPDQIDGICRHIDVI